MTTDHTTVQAPWTPEQWARLCSWQQTPWVHQLTCTNSTHGALVVTTEALECPKCGYRQTWAPRVVAENDPPPDPRVQLGLFP